MNERGGLERVSTLLSRQPMRGKPAQFVIDQRQQFRRRARITVLNALQNLSDITHARSY